MVLKISNTIQKVVQPTLANILGRKILVTCGKWHDIRDFLRFSAKKFPRMHSEIVLPAGLAKDQPQTVQISCNICAFIKHMHYPLERLARAASGSGSNSGSVSS